MSENHGWNHVQCDRCWKLREGNRVAARLAAEYVEAEPCCYCGAPTRSGIYRRDQPGSTAVPYCADTLTG